MLSHRAKHFDLFEPAASEILGAVAMLGSIELAPGVAEVCVDISSPLTPHLREAGGCVRSPSTPPALARSPTCGATHPAGELQPGDLGTQPSVPLTQQQLLLEVSPPELPRRDLHTK